MSARAAAPPAAAADHCRQTNDRRPGPAHRGAGAPAVHRVGRRPGAGPRCRRTTAPRRAGSRALDGRRSAACEHPGVPWRGRGELPREVGILAVVAFVVALGFGIVAPPIPLFAPAFGAGTTAVGLAVSAFAFFRLVSAFGGGFLVERFGERTVLSTGLGIGAVTTGLAGLATSFPLFLALRAAGGVDSAMFTVAALSLLLRVAPPSHRGRAAATWQGGVILGGDPGPAGGGALAQVSPRPPFFPYARLLLLRRLVP